MRSIVTSLIFLISLTDMFGQAVNNELKISHLTGNFYVFTTYKLFDTSKQAANGMYVVTDAGVVLFDSPWDTCPFQPLLDSIKAKHNKNVIIAFASHSHEDRTSGLDYYRQKGIKTYTTKQTDEISKANGRPRAEFLISKDTVFTVGSYTFQTYYGGEGHTKDNIVIWFEKEKILYGGCLVKSVEAKDLGYIGEANLEAWPGTIKKIQHKYRNIKFIIPGHYDWSSTESLNHTIKLVREQRKATH